MNCAKVQKVVGFTSLQPHFQLQITLPATSLTRALEINAMVLDVLIYSSYTHVFQHNCYKKVSMHILGSFQYPVIVTYLLMQWPLSIMIIHIDLDAYIKTQKA